MNGMKNLVFVIAMLWACSTFAQSKRTVLKHFYKDCKKVVFYCKDRKQYNDKVERLLDILEAHNIYYGFKAVFVRSNRRFKVEFYNRIKD